MKKMILLLYMKNLKDILNECDGCVCAGPSIGCGSVVATPMNTMGMGGVTPMDGDPTTATGGNIKQKKKKKHSRRLLSLVAKLRKDLNVYNV